MLTHTSVTGYEEIGTVFEYVGAAVSGGVCESVSVGVHTHTPHTHHTHPSVCHGIPH